jgi:hypothetical protein
LIVFTLIDVNVDVFEGSDLYLYSDSGESFNLNIENYEGSGPYISPDGEFIIYSSDEDLFVVELRKSIAYKLVSNVRQYKWGVDSNTIYYTDNDGVKYYQF